MIGRHALSAEAQEVLAELDRGDTARLHRLFAQDPIDEVAPLLLSREQEAALTALTEEMGRARAQGAANGAGYFIGGHA